MGRQKVSGSSYVAAAVRLLGAEVRIGRSRKHWSQQELAARCGISVSTVAAIESGSQSVSIGTVFQAATLCGIELFAGPDLPAMTRAMKGRTAILDLLPQRIHPHPVPDVDDFA